MAQAVGVVGDRTLHGADRQGSGLLGARRGHRHQGGEQQEDQQDAQTAGGASGHRAAPHGTNRIERTPGTLATGCDRFVNVRDGTMNPG